MVRWLLLGVLLWIVIRHINNDKAKKSEVLTKPVKPESFASELVTCDLCGLRFHREEAVLSTGGVYCCARHRDNAEGRATK